MRLLLELADIIFIGHQWSIPLWALLAGIPATKTKGQYLLESANLMLAVAAGILLVLHLWSLLSLFWIDNYFERFALSNRYLGPYWAINLAGIILFAGIPQLLWKKSIRMSAVASLIIWAGLWAQPFLQQVTINVQAQRDNLPSSWKIFQSIPWMTVGWVVYLMILTAITMIRWRLQAREPLSSK